MLMRFHRVTDPHSLADAKTHHHEARILAGVTISVFLVSLIFIEYNRYFNVWGKQPSLPDAFTEKYERISDYIINSNPRTAKYILVNEGDVLVDGVPNNAQTIKFLTKTHSNEEAKAKNVYYIREDQLDELISLNNNITLIPLSDSAELSSELRTKLGLWPRNENEITVYESF